jgi:hypothetical protein
MTRLAKVSIVLALLLALVAVVFSVRLQVELHREQTATASVQPGRSVCDGARDLAQKFSGAAEADPDHAGYYDQLLEVLGAACPFSAR